MLKELLLFNFFGLFLICEDGNGNFQAPYMLYQNPKLHSFLVLKKILFIYLFLESGEGREKERERNINVCLCLARPLLGTSPTTQACALTGNQTCEPLFLRLMLNPLSHTSQGPFILFIFFLPIPVPHPSQSHLPILFKLL